jgi:RNA polymerase-interacting CarD/CdnL/TRCF family regulator
MINRISFIKPLAVITIIGGLSMGCGPNADLVKKQAQEKAQASFGSEKDMLNSAKEMLQQQLDGTKSQLSEKDAIIQQLETEIAKMSE